MKKNQTKNKTRWISIKCSRNIQPKNAVSYLASLSNDWASPVHDNCLFNLCYFTWICCFHSHQVTHQCSEPSAQICRIRKMALVSHLHGTQPAGSQTPGGSQQDRSRFISKDTPPRVETLFVHFHLILKFHWDQKDKSIQTHWLTSTFPSITSDLVHCAHCAFRLVSTRRRYGTITSKSTRFKRGFIPTAVNILNTKGGDVFFVSMKKGVPKFWNCTKIKQNHFRCVVMKESDSEFSKRWMVPPLIGSARCFTRLMMCCCKSNLWIRKKWRRAQFEIWTEDNLPHSPALLVCFSSAFPWSPLRWPASAVL